MRRLRQELRTAPTWLVVLVIGLLAAGVNGLLVSLSPPAPRVHDEFSYLLAADTFASGRLTNPTHAHWPHFETMHVIQRPSYASKYPPGQGLLLAAGMIATGTALAGVWVSTGLAAATTTWMLLAFTPKRWAAVGGLLVATHAGIQLQWGMSYWGGALAMAAGALVIGGGARLADGLADRNTKRLTPACLFATGAVLLAVTRPFEGFVLTLGVAAVTLIRWLRQRDFDWRATALRVGLPVAAIGGGGLVALLAYNAAVTGSALKMPYQVHESEYGAAPLFLWQTPTRDQTYRNDPLRRYHLAASMWWFDQQQTFDGLLTMKAWLSRCSLEFFLPVPAALALLAAGWARSRRLWPWLGIGLATWGAACLTVWMFPHYLAPLAPLLVLLLVAGLRSFHAFERRLRPGRRWLTPALVGVQLLLFAVAAYDRVNLSPNSWAHGRQQFAAGLRNTPGDDLVFVRYAPDHNVHNEWVYNGADIDNAPIVWARELGPEQDGQLVEHFRDRRVWLMLADERPLRLAPYTGPLSTTDGELAAK